MNNKSIQKSLSEKSDDEKLKILRKKGNIITFKMPFYPKGDNFKQIIVTGFLKENNSVKIEGCAFDTPWLTVSELIDAVDWDFMECAVDELNF